MYTNQILKSAAKFLNKNLKNKQIQEVKKSVETKIKKTLNKLARPT